MIALLIENPILLLFVVASLGYLVGNIKIRGGSLGVAAVLFVGLAFGATDARLHIPDIVLLIGLSIFVYTIGLSSGPAFFQSYRRNGLRDFGFILLVMLGTGFLAGLLWLLFDFSAGAISGIYTGSTTNTPALAGVVDLINNSLDKAQATQHLDDVVVGYSFSYPMGVLGGMIAIVLVEKMLKINYKQEEFALRKEYPVGEDLTSATVEIEKEGVCGQTVRDLFKQYDWNVVFGRILKQGEDTRLVNWDTVFETGDKVMVVGTQEELEKVGKDLGKPTQSLVLTDLSKFDRRRIFVSNPLVSGRSIASLNIHEKYDVVITRIRRGDIDMLAKSNTVLEQGDRIRFIARREDLKEISRYFGDSYRQASSINLFSFGLGLALGLMLGAIEFSLSSQVSFKLGYAGGPLIVGLILGALRRTGPVVWTLPYSANVSLQQLGLMFLLAAIGVRSGNAFIDTFSLEGIWYFLASAILSLTTAFSILLIGYKALKMPFSLLMGMVANQPAILDFANSRAGNRIPVFGFSLMFPIGLIAKILIAQLLFLLLR
jgi:putative transport protein